MQQVPFFDYKRLYRRNRKIYLEVIDNVLSRAAFILQSDVAQFESRLAQYVGAKHAIAVADGTMALYLSLRSAGIGAGDEVIVSTHTFIATCSAIVAVGAVPVPVDCTSDLMMSPDSATQAVTSATQAIMAISEFPKWRKYLILLSFLDNSSARPVQIGGVDVNICHSRVDLSPRTPAVQFAIPSAGAILSHTDGPCGS